MIAIEELLTPASADSPCGPDPEHHVQFQLLALAARGKPAQEMGERSTKAVPPDWNAVKVGALRFFAGIADDDPKKALGPTRDLRVAVLLTRALLQMEALVGFEAGLRLINGLLDRHWDHVHPQLDPDDGDASLRVNAICELINPDELIKEIREALVAPAVRQGRVRVRDVHVATGKSEPRKDEPRLTEDQVGGLLLESEKTHPGCIDAARNTVVVLDAIQRKLVEMLGADNAPSLKPLRDQLAPVSAIGERLLRRNAESGESASDGTAGADEDTMDRSQTTAVPAGTRGDIRSVDDAVKVLDRVCEFIDRTQPSHPAPLLLRRAQRLMKMNFVEIIADMAPDSLGTIKQLAGVKDE